MGRRGFSVLNSSIVVAVIALGIAVLRSLLRPQPGSTGTPRMAPTGSSNVIARGGEGGIPFLGHAPVEQAAGSGQRESEGRRQGDGGVQETVVCFARSSRQEG